MKKKNWVTELLEESGFDYFKRNNPKLVEYVRKALQAGESVENIKSHCRRILGESLTARWIGHMVDHVGSELLNDGEPGK